MLKCRWKANSVPLAAHSGLGRDCIAVFLMLSDTAEDTSSVPARHCFPTRGGCFNRINRVINHKGNRLIVLAFWFFHKDLDGWYFIHLSV